MNPSASQSALVWLAEPMIASLVEAIMLFSATVRLVTSDMARTGPFITCIEAAPTAPTSATAPNSAKKTFPDCDLKPVLKQLNQRRRPRLAE